MGVVLKSALVRECRELPCPHPRKHHNAVAKWYDLLPIEFEFPKDRSRTPVGLVLLGPYDQLFDLERKLIGMPIRTSRSIRQPFETAVVIAADDLVAGLARDAELAAQRRNRLAIQNYRNEFNTEAR